MISFNEAGEFISSFRSRTPFVAFHKKNDDTTIIKLTPWDKKRKFINKDGEDWHETPAWGISVTRNSSQTFKLPIEAGESVVLEQLLKSYINDCLESNSRDYSKQEKSNNDNYNKPPVNQKPKVDYSEEDVPF